MKKVATVKRPKRINPPECVVCGNVSNIKRTKKIVNPYGTITIRYCHCKTQGCANYNKLVYKHVASAK